MDLAAACRQLEVLLSAPAAAARFPLALDGLRAIRDDQDRDPEREPAAHDFARWLIECGRDHGLRPLTADERADATGHGTFFRDLGLDGLQLYDAVGSHFDPCSFQRRCFPLLRAWQDGCPPTPPDPLSPADILAEARQLRAIVHTNLPLEPLPPSVIPDDVLAHLRAAGLWPLAALDSPARP